MFNQIIMARKEANSSAESEMAHQLQSIGETIGNLTLDLPTLPQPVSKTDFTDNEWINKPALKLFKLDDAETCSLGRELLSILSSGVPQQHVGIIFVLAFQLRQPGPRPNDRIFPNKDPLATTQDLQYNELSPRIYGAKGTKVTPRTYGNDDNKQACAYAYIAASMLRLFTRSAGNYLEYWNRILNDFKKFYTIDCPIYGFSPCLSVLESIRFNFSHSEIYKVTLYRYLYMANDQDKAIGLRNYLYDTAISHTGMHIVSIFVRLCLSLNISPAELLVVVYMGRFKRQIDELIIAIKLMKNTDEDHRRMMWKYGRIFDETFLLGLQSRTCPHFVYLIASMLKEENDESAANILWIRQLEEVSEDYKVEWREKGKKLLKMIHQVKEEV
ncbi:hypothetical protein ACJIZ3_007269 [Penstemon smallii]|uniref:Uncharacterized protein n=1 Tax=Penstemon smallii TaxID=265156 RepID=A0ABD3SA13_9LAMI